MTNTASEHAQEGQLVRFEVVPREAIRASFEIFQRVLKTLKKGSAKHAEAEQWETSADILLCNRSYDWPLSLQPGSSLAISVENIVSAARMSLYNIHDVSFRLIVGKYLPALPCFYTEVIGVRADGRLIEGDALVINQQYSVQWKGRMNTMSAGAIRRMERRKSTDIDKYKDPNLLSGECSMDFEKIVWAATLKSQLFPHECVRDGKWRERRCADFNAIPQKLRDTVTVHRDRDRTLVELDPVVSLTSSAKRSDEDIKETPSLDSTDEKESSEPVLTPAESRLPSPAQTERSTTPTDPNDLHLKLSFLALLEGPGDGITVSINPSRVDCPEMKTLDATKQMWEFMAMKGCSDKVRLDELFFLAQKMENKDFGASPGS